MLWVFGGILSFSLFHALKQSKVLSTLRKAIESEGAALKEEKVLPVVFRVLKNKSFERLTFRNKAAMAKDLLGEVIERKTTGMETLVSLLLYVLLVLTPCFVLVGVAMGKNLGYFGGEHSEGVYSFCASGDGERVFVLEGDGGCGYVLSRDGEVLLEVEGKKIRTDEELGWGSCRGAEWFCYSRRANGRLALERKRGKPRVACLVDIATGREELIGQPALGDGHWCSYEGWDESGCWLLGTVVGGSNDGYQVRSMFTTNVETGEIREIGVEASEFRLCYGEKFIDEDRVLVGLMDDGDSSDQRYAIFNFETGEKAFHTLKDVVDWEFCAGDGSLYMLRKVFGENEVGHEIVEQPVDGGEVRVVVGSGTLPRCSFEDVVRGKELSISLWLSEHGEWLTYEVLAGDEERVTHLVNVDTGDSWVLSRYEKPMEVVSMAYSPDETRLCATYGSYDYEEVSESDSACWIEVYDLAEVGPRRVQRVELGGLRFDADFWGDDHVLYIRSTDDESGASVNELRLLDVVEGTDERFGNLE